MEPMRYMLNGGFTFQGEQYWRVDDLDRMQAEEEAGTYSAIAHLKRFGIAISQHNLTREQAQKMVDAINAALETKGQ